MDTMEDKLIDEYSKPSYWADLKNFALDVHNFAYGTKYNDCDIVSAMDFDAIIKKMKDDEKNLLDANKGLYDLTNVDVVEETKNDINRLKGLIIKEKKKTASLQESLSKATDKIDELETHLTKVPKKSMNYKYMKELEGQVYESHMKLTDILTQLDHQKMCSQCHEQQAGANHVRYLDEQVKVYEQTEKVKELTDEVKKLTDEVDGNNLLMDFMGCHDDSNYDEFNIYLHQRCSKEEYKKFYEWFSMEEMGREFIKD